MANFISAEVILLLGMDLSGGGNEIRYAENTGRSHIETNSVVMHRIQATTVKSILHFSQIGKKRVLLARNTARQNNH